MMMKEQNIKLKQEFLELKRKLEECVEKTKRKAKKNVSPKPSMTEEDQCNEKIIYF